MKLAWICYDSSGDKIIMFYEPDDYLFEKIVPIVYSEIEK